MRFNLSKNKYSWGIYLGNTVLALSALTQSSIAHNEYLSKNDVLTLCNQISWRLIANNKIVEAKEGSWITDEYYSDSIRNVIGKALADCITGKNEFAGKTSIDDTITFAVGAETYTPANWNAVVLWNLIHVYNCGYKKDKGYTIEQAFEQVKENVTTTYSAKIKGFDKILEKAISDIKKYAQELSFESYLCEYSELAKRNMKNGPIKTGFSNQVAPWMYLDGTSKPDNCKNNKYGWLGLEITHMKGIEAQDVDKKYYSSCEFRYSDKCWYLSIYHVGNNTIEYSLTDKEEEKRNIYSKICSKIIKSLVKHAEMDTSNDYIRYILDTTEIDEMLK